jgi:PPE-repeat protein
MDFAFLPPEINSARMYSGPGSGSLLAAAGSWDSLAAELNTTAETYGSVLSSLTTLHWHGPASASMQATVTPYVGWLYTTAEQTTQTAMQVRAAAAAFEQAYAMTVPPPAVTANRVQLGSLIATNFFGQNTAAIAATEAQYAEMWAQDGAAMFCYASSSAAATQLTPFTFPQQTTAANALSAQSAAVSQAVSTPAADAQSVLSQLGSNLTSALTGLTNVPTKIVPADFTALDGLFAVYSTITDVQAVESIVGGVIGAENNLGILPDLGAAAAAAPAELAPALTGVNQLNGAASGLGGTGLGNITATLARANTIGPMSVPAAWSAPSAHTVSALSGAGLTTLPGTDELAESGSGMPGVPGMPAGTLSRASGVIPRYGVRLTVMTRPLAGG